MEHGYPEVKLKVAGIFKGGGAKGIVYAGALRELRARGVWFDTVAGSSAGAITATLITCGVDPDTLPIVAGEALSHVQRQIFRGFLPWVDRSPFRTNALEEWLENQLWSATGKSADAGPITFRQLAQGPDAIELNVVAMDLDRRQPIVFNATTTPNSSVARAVVGSCSIPVLCHPAEYYYRPLTVHPTRFIGSPTTAHGQTIPPSSTATNPSGNTRAYPNSIQPITP